MPTHASKLLAATFLAALAGVPLAHAETKGTPAPMTGPGDTMMGDDMQGMMQMMQMMAKMAPMMEACTRMMQTMPDQPATPMTPQGEDNKG